MKTSAEKLDLGTFHLAHSGRRDALSYNLRIGYIDLYLIHSAHGGKEHRLKFWQALIDGKKAGLLRDIGVSN